MENGEELSPQTAINTIQNGDQQSPGRTRSNSASSGHKRSLSGSLLSKLSFLRMSQSSSVNNNEALASPSHSDEIDRTLNRNDERNPTSNDGYSGGSRAGGTSRAMATAIQHQRKMRRRRGSLRKTALLGTRLEVKEKRNNNANTARDQLNYGGVENSRGVQSPLSISTGNGKSRITPPSSTHLTDEGLTPRESMDRDGDGHTSVYSGYWPRSLTMDRGVVSSDINKSPTSIGDTTDEEDNISLSNYNANTTTNNNTMNSGRTTSTHLRPSSVSSSGSINPPLMATPSSSSDSYFLSSRHHIHHHHHRHHQTSSANEATDATARPLGRSPTTHRARSPLIAPELSSSASNTLDVGVSVGVGGWDYSETEWWGWIILLVTWLVFVVGIGSSFGVWSWAWDVGETPYAPPELEDDPTLPIVGYYPALMVLTAVMAWVWVVVAWVGMKYFKHANIAADEG
ncbi:hypothetical protein EYB25_005911 [Talaromyces marneffei]|uniref:Uncharacterized protein n=1 Tax=Talaromyces marneffei PM1 TaxID=1077442 RepID=A0A093VAD9_TALMA|nr:uncharacterized protein EYB26_006794 [Talaromyces marneffei]KAE8552020.1 hypothetical protein EYB25_005911 [Talaromyces marneffei]QGA19106.1 hypothetical protein EYB26_006794 [Talaromyces marneffei]